MAIFKENLMNDISDPKSRGQAKRHVQLDQLFLVVDLSNITVLA
jgi:hypothetical protein